MMRSTRVFFRSYCPSILAGMIFLVTITAANVRAHGQELDVLAGWVNWSDAANLLQRHLNSLAFQHLDARARDIAALESADDWRSRQAEVRRKLNELLGPFPEKTPLNARVTSTSRKAGFRIEKVLFESMPGFTVTGCLFLPDLPEGARAPAILNVIGHTAVAFRSASYQQLILNLVKKGFIVFAMDPIGQGERLQYYDSLQGRSLVGGPTREHSHVGVQCFLTGNSAARYFTWDGIRAIDYLVSRPEVDPNRIGVTGISGGGTQTSYVSAVDDRVLAAAPANYICGFRRLFESIGPQDAEQNLNGGVRQGIDHADFLEVRAPRPTLVVATTRDFFSVQGARETVAEARKAFEALGSANHLAYVEDDHTHGYTRKNREAIYAFFQEHLRNPGDPGEVDAELIKPEEMTVTSTGQIADSVGGETVFSLNKKLAIDLRSRIEKSRQNLPEHLPRVAHEARRLTGFRSPQPGLKVVFRGRYQRTGYTIEQYVLGGEGDLVLPVLFWKPEGVEKPRVILDLNPEGKSASAEPGGELEALVRQGYAVLSADLAGVGELGSAGNSVAFLAVQLGTSVVGLRAEDIIRCLEYLESRGDVNLEGLTAVGRGSMAIPLLHAAAFDARIQRVGLIEPLISFATVAENPYYNYASADLVANALTAYDLPDLEASLAPRDLLVVTPQDHLFRPATRQFMDRELDVVRRAYEHAGAAGNFQIHRLEAFESSQELLLKWLPE